MVLTVKKVQRLVAKGEPGMFLDKGGTRGLYLAVESKTSAHWALRFQVTTARDLWAWARHASSA